MKNVGTYIYILQLTLYKIIYIYTIFTIYITYTHLTHASYDLNVSLNSSINFDENVYLYSSICCRHNITKQNFVAFACT